MAEIQRIASITRRVARDLKERPAWVFKHSLTCCTSSAAWAEFRRFAADRNGRHLLRDLLYRAQEYRRRLRARLGLQSAQAAVKEALHFGGLARRAREDPAASAPAATPNWTGLVFQLSHNYST